MTVLRVILGVLIMLTAFDCLMFPPAGAVAFYIMVSVLMLVCGIAAIIHFIESKNREKVAKSHGIQYAGAGVGSLIAGIVSVVLSILALRSPEGSEVFFKIISILFGLFIIIHGISSITLAVLIKKTGVGGWVAMIILGILEIILGIFVIANTFASFIAIGVMVGVSMLIFGINLIFGVGMTPPEA